MRVVIVGAGGVGGYFGARLAAAGEEVAVVARGAHLRAIQERGLRVHSIHGDVQVDVEATDDAAQVGHCDVVLFCVKAFHTDAAAAEHLPALVGEDTAVVSLQNGVDNEERIAQAVGWPRVLGGLALIFAGIREPGVIAHTGGPGKLVFGEFDGSQTPRVTALHRACVDAGIDAEVAADIRAALWHKYAFICAQAGTTAAIRLPIGDIRAEPMAWQLFRRLVEETYAVARSVGVTIPRDAVDQRLAFAQQLDAGSHSSLYDDLVNGRRMELDALHGTVVRLAREQNVPVPASEAVLGVLEPWARRNQGGRRLI